MKLIKVLKRLFPFGKGKTETIVIIAPDSVIFVIHSQTKS
jgi:hypothetical protein